MSKLKCILAICFAFTLTATASEPPKPAVAPEIKSKAFLADVSLEPYYTVGWQGINGQSKDGFGANLVTHLNQTFSLWAFGESDDTEGVAIDRAGGGIRAEAKLGAHLKFDAGIGAGYSMAADALFIRVPFGVTAVLIQSKSLELGPRLAYAFDISGDGKHGTADGRFFAGLVATLKL